MLVNRWRKFGPLTGLLFAALVVAALVANSAYTPKPGADAAKVVSFYTQHQSHIETSAVLFALAYTVLVLFAGTIGTYLRDVDTSLGWLVLASGVLITAGGLACVAIEYSLAHNIGNLSPESAKTLNLISAELFVAARAGVFTFGVCAGIAILGGSVLPKWLGWAAVAIAIAMLLHIAWAAGPVPHLGFYAVFAFVGWSALAGVFMYRRPAGPRAASVQRRSESGD